MGPRPIGALVLGVAERIGHRALAHQLDQAARLSGAAAARARREAERIADVLALGETQARPVSAPLRARERAA